MIGGDNADGSKMMCKIWLKDVDSVPIANTITLKKQYVVKGNEIWTASYTAIRDSIDFILEGEVREGPKWGPDIEVDVVCEFEELGSTHRIIAISQQIEMAQ